MTKPTFLAALALSACTPSSPPPSALPSPIDDARPLTAFTSDGSGFDTNTWWLDTGREVVVFDAQFTVAHAERAIAAIRSTTSSPITWLVVTHPNPDKFNGAPAFQAIGAKVVASKATAAAIPGVHAYKKAFFVGVGAFTAATYPAEPRIDQTFEGSLSIAGGAVELAELRHPGVSTTQTVARIAGQKAIVVGDLVHTRTHAWLEGGIRDGRPAPDLAAWRAALDELAGFAGWTVHPGRGPAAPLDQALSEQKTYLTQVDEIVRSYVAALPDKSELSGSNAAVHWKALTAAAVKAFPEHGLPYLIEYGVYGLALRHAR
jgi:glyoxylase-like metal-dependent hydrolase (beta-lactamase superfamily II)